MAATLKKRISILYPFLQWQVQVSLIEAHVAPFLHGFVKQTNEEHSDIANPSSASLNMWILLAEICKHLIKNTQSRPKLLFYLQVFHTSNKTGAVYAAFNKLLGDPAQM